MAVRQIEPIDRAELRATVQKWIDAHTDVDDTDGVGLLEDVLWEINAQPTLAPPNEWVSVYDRLPEPGERVLATDCGFVGEFYINKRGKWQRYNVNCSELLMALDILYWMPLPEPPDRRPPEEEEDNE